jgi:hypothetical protein
MTPDARIEAALAAACTPFPERFRIRAEMVTLVSDTERRVREEAAEKVAGEWQLIGCPAGRHQDSTCRSCFDCWKEWVLILATPTVTPPLDSNPPDVTIQPPREEVPKLCRECDADQPYANPDKCAGCPDAPLAPQPNQLTPEGINQIGSAPQEGDGLTCIHGVYVKQGCELCAANARIESLEAALRVCEFELWRWDGAKSRGWQLARELVPPAPASGEEETP